MSGHSVRLRITRNCNGCSRPPKPFPQFAEGPWGRAVWRCTRTACRSAEYQSGRGPMKGKGKTPNITANIEPPAFLRLLSWATPFILNNSPQNVNVHRICASHTNPENELRVLGLPTPPPPPKQPWVHTNGTGNAVKNWDVSRTYVVFFCQIVKEHSSIPAKQNKKQDNFFSQRSFNLSCCWANILQFGVSVRYIFPLLF